MTYFGLSKIGPKLTAHCSIDCSAQEWGHPQHAVVACLTARAARPGASQAPRVGLLCVGASWGALQCVSRDLVVFNRCMGTPGRPLPAARWCPRVPQPCAPPGPPAPGIWRCAHPSSYNWHWVSAHRACSLVWLLNLMLSPLKAHVLECTTSLYMFLCLK